MTDRSNDSFLNRSAGWMKPAAALAIGIVLLVSGCGSDSAANDPAEGDAPATTQADGSGYESPVTAVEPTTTEKPK